MREIDDCQGARRGEARCNISCRGPGPRPSHDGAQARQTTMVHVPQRRHEMLEGKRAEVEVASLRLGDQVQADWLPLLGIAYDSKDDIVEVVLEGLDHLIPNPREIYVDDDPLGLLTFEIVNADDVREIIRFRDPLALPAPARTSGL